MLPSDVRTFTDSINAFADLIAKTDHHMVEFNEALDGLIRETVEFKIRLEALTREERRRSDARNIEICITLFIILSIFTLIGLEIVF